MTEWIWVENKNLDDEPEVVAITTHIPKKGNTTWSAKYEKIGTFNVQQDTHRHGE